MPRIRSILICLLSAGFLSAQSPDERLSVGDDALRDHLLVVAGDQFAAVLAITNGVNELQRSRAVLGLARTRYAQGQLQAAVDILRKLPVPVPPTLRIDTGLLRAELSMLQENLSETAVLLDSLPATGLSDAQAHRLRRLRGRLLTAQGNGIQAMAHYKAWTEETPGDPAAWLDQALAFQKSGATNEARLAWAQAAGGPVTDPDVQDARLRLAALDLAEGEVGSAAQRLDKLFSSNILDQVLAPRAYRLRSGVLEAQGRLADAARHVAALETLTPDPLERARLRIQRARLSILQGDLVVGADLLGLQIAALGDDPAAAATQLLLARAYAEREDYDNSAAAFQTYLDTFSDPIGRQQATLGMARALEQQGLWEAAGRMYEKAWRAGAENDPTRPSALIKWADMLFAQQDYKQAGEQYRLFPRTYPGHDLVPQALFQAALCRHAEGRTEPALDELDRLRALYPDSPFAERALLERAGMLNRALRLEQALGAYDAYLERYPNGTYGVEAMTDKGLTAYRLGLFDLALRQFDAVLARFPEHERAEQAFFMRGWALYLTGRDQEALEVCRVFLTTYPDSRWAPDVRFWVAEHAFNHGSYEEAEREFIRLSDDAQDPDAKSKARYLAGRAAIARKQFQRALDHFTLSLQLAPSSDRVADTLFYEGDTLTELNRFDAAIVVFDQLIQQYPRSYLVFPAWGRKGDCQFTLGEQDAARLAEALASYRMVDESGSADASLKLQAAYKIGRTLDRMGRGEEALSHFLRAVYRYRDNRGSLGPDADIWFVRAATDAAQAYEKQQDWRKAIEMYRMMVEAGVPQAREAEKRIQNLRMEHLILF